eukprot:s2072_g10.t1
MQPLASRQLECNILSVHTHVAKVGRTWWSQNDNDVTVDGHVPSETRDGMRSWWMLLSLCLRTEAQIRAAQQACRGQANGSLCHYLWPRSIASSGQDASESRIAWGHCYLLDVWRDGSGGLFDFDGRLRSSMLACLEDDKLTADELAAMGFMLSRGIMTRTTADLQMDETSASRLTQILAWVVGGGWQVLAVVSSTLCCLLAVAMVTVSRCLHAEAETFIGWLPIRVSAGSFTIPASKTTGIERGRRGRTRRLQWSRGFCPCAAAVAEVQYAANHYIEVRCSNAACVRRIPSTPCSRATASLTRQCLGQTLCGWADCVREKEKKKKEKRKSTSRRDAAAFQARNEEEVTAAIKTWSEYAHPRANDFFSSPEQLEDVLRQLAKGIDKNDDPILGSEERCVYWYGDVTKEDLQAAIRMVKPGESAESVTYVNRVLAFIFATDESFDKLMKLPKVHERVRTIQDELRRSAVRTFGAYLPGHVQLSLRCGSRMGSL